MIMVVMDTVTQAQYHTKMTITILHLLIAIVMEAGQVLPTLQQVILEDTKIAMIILVGTVAHLQDLDNPHLIV